MTALVADIRSADMTTTTDKPTGETGKALADALNRITADAKTEKTEKPTPPKKTSGPLKKRLQDSFVGVGMSLAFIDPTCGTVIVERAEMLAESFDTLARENPAVKRVLEGFTQSSAWGGVIMAVGGTALPIMAHHDMIPKLGAKKKKPLAAVKDIKEGRTEDRNERESVPEQPPVEGPKPNPEHDFNTPVNSHDHPEGFPYHEHADGKHERLSENPPLGNL